MTRYHSFVLSLFFIGSSLGVVDCFTTTRFCNQQRARNTFLSPTPISVDTLVLQKQQQTVLKAIETKKKINEDDNDSLSFVTSFYNNNKNHRRAVTSIATAVVLSVSMLFGTHMAYASEIGVEVEAETFVSGETVEICIKRGILGACAKTEMRTVTNDNDIANKYFQSTNEILKQQKEATLLRNQIDIQNDNNNEFIQKLKQQSLDNAEKNDLYVQRKTFENDQSATFGPFDRQVLIMNTDGKTFTLLQNPQAMRLKKAGYIDDRRSFIKQPTQDEIDEALQKSEEGNFLSGIFGS